MYIPDSGTYSSHGSRHADQWT